MFGIPPGKVPEPRCLQLLGSFLACKEPGPKFTEFLFWGLSEGSVYVDAKPKSLEQLKKVVEFCARNVYRETETSRKLQKKNHFMQDK